MAVKIQWRRGTAAEWTAANTLLAQGESGFELDTLRWKVGDGVRNWNVLPYSSGVPGATGPAGATGPQGAKGDTGSTGPQGDPGPAGATGPPSTVPGPAGAAGAQGPKGDTGSQGAQGVQGPAGSTGSQGPAGAAGEKWFSGTGAPAGATGVVGDWYLNDASGDVYEKTGASAWTLRDNLTGPQGAQGVQGPAGSGAADATTSSKGSIQLAGDLAGTAASPQIAAGAIVDADINAAAAIALSKLATNPLARANHTGTQLAATVSDFDAQVRTSRLDQMAAPTAGVALNSQKITGLADPTAAQEGATKNYVDLTAFALDAKPSVRAASTANLTLSGAQTVDGVSLAAADRVLVKNQTTQSQNGIYQVQAGAWTRPADSDGWNDQVSAFVFVEQGTVNADTGWLNTSNPGGTVGTTAITWAKFTGGAQVATTYSVTAGYGADRAFNPQSTTLNEVAAVLGTLIDDMRAAGMIA